MYGTPPGVLEIRWVGCYTNLDLLSRVKQGVEGKKEFPSLCCNLSPLIIARLHLRLPAQALITPPNSAQALTSHSPANTPKKIRSQKSSSHNTLKLEHSVQPSISDYIYHLLSTNLESLYHWFTSVLQASIFRLTLTAWYSSDICVKVKQINNQTIQLSNDSVMEILVVYQPKTQSGIGHAMSSSDTRDPIVTRITTLGMCLEKVCTEIVP